MTSLRKLASDLGMTVSQVRTSLNKLQLTGEVDTVKSKRFTKIILLNYESYQADVIGTNHLVKHVNNNKVFYEMALKDIGWHEQLCMHNKIKIVQVKIMLDKFFSKIESSDDRKPTYREFRLHFLNWQKYETETQDVYHFKWQGQAPMKGTKDHYERAKKTYDMPGFDFKLIKVVKQ